MHERRGRGMFCCLIISERAAMQSVPTFHAHCHFLSFSVLFDQTLPHFKCQAGTAEGATDPYPELHLSPKCCHKYTGL
eukprot:1148910-Pelagomonas_calceolata.AAC.4